MSIESAREHYNDVVANEERCWATKEQESEAWALLILEVQAAMPCIREGAWQVIPEGEGFMWMNECECPSCKARQALKVTA